VGVRLCEECIKKDSRVWSGAGLKIQVTHVDRRSSISNNFYSEQDKDKKIPHHKLNEEALKLITQLLLNTQKRYLSQRARKDHLIQPYLSFPSSKLSTSGSRLSL
jgi:hypothetical protein